MDPLAGPIMDVIIGAYSMRPDTRELYGFLQTIRVRVVGVQTLERGDGAYWV